MQTTEYSGTILAVRNVEDLIRSTQKYTKFVFTKPNKPRQGSEFPTKLVREHYEVYPELVVNLDMDIRDFADWVWGDVKSIVVHFCYYYNRDKATICIDGNHEHEQLLINGIPGMGIALDAVKDSRKRAYVK